MATLSPRTKRDQYDFRPDVLDVIISGKSTIDTPNGFQLTSVEEAKSFVDGYGYDLEKPVESAEGLGNFHEALNFIRKNFLQPENPNGLKIEVPRKILDIITRARRMMAKVFTSATGPAASLRSCTRSRISTAICARPTSAISSSRFSIASIK
jgi:uncharacterized protein (TIGR04562 family)